MRSNDLSRREFNKLSMAALGGALSGAFVAGCNGPQSDMATTSVMLLDPHTCRGLNTCQGKGAGGDNTCAGQGKCATAKAHTCSGQNDCKGQGGCGEQPGMNDCKGQGKCSVPLSAEAWAKARANFEKAMTEAGNKFGSAPAA